MFAREGAKVWATDVDDEKLKETVRLAGCSDRDEDHVVGVLLDVADADAVKKSFAACRERFGTPDVVFANAGVVGIPAPFTDADDASFDFVFGVNVKGVFHLLKEGALLMIDRDAEADMPQGGSLIATSSVAGLRSGAGDSVYSASKAAVISLVQTISNQLTGTNIRANAICPGLVETGMTKPVFDFADSRGVRKKIGKLNPMLRYGEPEEIASVALFLASRESSYVNGQAIAVCGGLSSSHPVNSRGKLKVSA